MKATKQIIPPFHYKQKLKRPYSPIFTSAHPLISFYNDTLAHTLLTTCLLSTVRNLNYTLFTPRGRRSLSDKNDHRILIGLKFSVPFLWRYEVWFRVFFRSFQKALRIFDHNTFLRNCPPTPPLSQL